MYSQSIKISRLTHACPRTTHTRGLIVCFDTDQRVENTNVSANFVFVYQKDGQRKFKSSNSIWLLIHWVFLNVMPIEFFYVNNMHTFGICKKYAIKRFSVRLYLQLIVGGLISYLCLLAYRGVQHILCGVFLRLVYPILPISLDCLFLIAIQVFSNVYYQ